MSGIMVLTSLSRFDDSLLKEQLKIKEDRLVDVNLYNIVIKKDGEFFLVYRYRQ